jgi:hypothetical protein
MSWLRRRTIDVLKQLPKLPHIPSATKRASDRALQAINRAPVAENVDDIVTVAGEPKAEGSVV